MEVLAENSSPKESAAPASPNRSRGLLVARGREVGPQILVVVVLFFVGGVLLPGFISVNSVRSQLVIASFLGICSVGEVLVILAGGMDVSIPSMISVGNVLTAGMYSSGVNVWLVLLLIAAIGLVVGVVNGVVSRATKTHSLLITLATGVIVQGVLLVATNGGNVIGMAPQVVTQIVAINGHIGPVPVPPVLLIWLVLAFVIVFALGRTSIGRQLYAVGANEPAAVAAGLNIWRPWLAAFCVSGVLGGFTGFLLAGFSGTADVNIGDPYLFMTIAAVVVGGTSLLGGRGGYGRTVLGVLILEEIQTIIEGRGGSSATSEMILGLLVILLVAIYGREGSIASRL